MSDGALQAQPVCETVGMCYNSSRRVVRSTFMYCTLWLITATESFLQLEQIQPQMGVRLVMHASMYISSLLSCACVCVSLCVAG